MAYHPCGTANSEEIKQMFDKQALGISCSSFMICTCSKFHTNTKFDFIGYNKKYSLENHCPETPPF